MTASDILRSARPDVTVDLMRRTGLDDAMLVRPKNEVLFFAVRACSLINPVAATLSRE
ncbi:hypothetical protein KM031_17605 (plasmid) [Gemmobacter fulvus]|uniref:Uncharacterized protein n=1 Tax=Gemmobacter fulvus TaxID=2840474 RepID=A0A975S3I1_9RHOB|nr:hypothetical protein [Gemmobacter fulvus]MBT9246123.1 hypothetical protein [Gemmobacter fulvus]MDQ1850084.1 hypothetical protein [Gemmobacter fulvus]QWK92123.1 hypothetical protein KM031_17605 [Gemmobacter fulvus]